MRVACITDSCYWRFGDAAEVVGFGVLACCAGTVSTKLVLLRLVSEDVVHAWPCDVHATISSKRVGIHECYVCS